LIALATTIIAGLVGPARALPPPPPPPQIGELPGADLIPDLSHAPVQVQGLTLNEPPVTDPAIGGTFGAPFAEPGVSCPRENEGMPANNPTAPGNCKPAAVSVAVLPNGNIVYWDGIEAEENVVNGIVFEIGDAAVNDQSRVMTINGANPPGSTWVQPTPVDGGAQEPASQDQYILPNAPPPLDQVFNDPGQALGALFCSDLVFLSNGKLLVPGGTHYYSEPHVPGTAYGVAELEGLRATRIFDPATNTWSQSGDMHFGRWYPSLVTLADGKVFVASGVTKLIKPVYTSNPRLSGTNVKQTETYNPATGKWTNNGASAKHSLPLFPRLHLLPDGKVYYDAAGQVFNPMGEAYDELLWNRAAVYNPNTKSWKYVGIPFGISADLASANVALTLGFRGSSFSVMLPLTPDGSGKYTKASFLSAGGVLGVTPGAHFSNTSSIINSVDTANGDKFTSTATAPLNNARWYSTGVLLPTGQVIAFSGANRDEVQAPAAGFPVHQAELFDPATGKWSRLASGHDDRTYHNTATLLPTGQVLVGGHSPISTLYGYNQTLPGGFSNAWRDPSFELYNPPYLYWGPRPAITSAPSALSYGQSITVGISGADSSDIASVVLVRNGAITHLVDGDQREVVLPITQRGAGTVTVTAPPSGKVTPPGPYMLFVNKTSSQGLIPSVAKQLFVGSAVSVAPPVPVTGASIGISSASLSKDATLAPASAGVDVTEAQWVRLPVSSSRGTWPLAATSLVALAASSTVLRRRRRGRLAVA
jgi:hypothetical protein